jgi:hypothetical protein
MVRDTTIRINVDVLKSVGAIDKLHMTMNKTGPIAQKNADQVTAASDRSAIAIQNMGDKAAASAVKFQTMGQGMLNLSTSAVQTFTSFSNLDRAYNRNKMAAIGVERATDLLNMKQLKYNDLVDKGKGHTAQAILLHGQLATATHDLTVKKEKLKIETAAVLDVQLLFAANIANVAVSSLMIYKTMFDGVTIAQVRNKIATIANRVATKINNLSKWSFVPAGAAQRVSLMAGSGALATHTLATRAATLATKALTIALGPVGWIIMGISAALVAYETNFMGFKDSINGFLGIQEKANEVVEEGTGVLDLHSDALDGVNSSLGKLPSSYQAAQRALKAYQTDLEKFPKDLVIPVLGQVTNGTQVNGTRIKNDGVSDPQTGNLTGNMGLPSHIPRFLQYTLLTAGLKKDKPKPNYLGLVEGLTNDQTREVDRQVAILKLPTKERPQGYSDAEIEDYFFLKKFTSGLEFTEEAFRASNLADLQRDILRNGMIPSKFDIEMENRFSPLFGGEFLIPTILNKVYSEIFGRDVSEYEANKLFKQLREGIVPFGKEEREFYKIYGNVDKRGEANKKLSISFSTLSNRDFVKTVLGLDIGGVANSMDRNDAIRIALIEKQLGAAGNGLVRTNDVGNTMRNNIISQLINSNNAGGLLRQGGVSARTGKNAFGQTITTYTNFGAGFYGEQVNSATAVFQVGRTLNGDNGFNIDPIFAQRRKESDAYAKSGLPQLGGVLRRIQGGSNNARPLSRSGARAWAKMGVDAMINSSPNSSILWSDSQLSADFAQINETIFGGDDINDSYRFRQGDVMRAIKASLEAIGSSTDRMEGITAGIGINVDYNAPLIQHQSLWSNRKGQRIISYTSSKESPTEQIRLDIGASLGINFLTGAALATRAIEFGAGGNFTNFNNVGITKLAMAGLNKTEQNVFDIRFAVTRGDRELLNSLRYAERLQAGSSGVSPL